MFTIKDGFLYYNEEKLWDSGQITLERWRDTGNIRLAELPDVRRTLKVYEIVPRRASDNSAFMDLLAEIVCGGTEHLEYYKERLWRRLSSDPSDYPLSIIRG